MGGTLGVALTATHPDITVNAQEQIDEGFCLTGRNAGTAIADQDLLIPIGSHDRVAPPGPMVDVVRASADRDQVRFAHQRASYRARGGVTTLRGPRRKDPVPTLRTVYIWSSARAHAAAAVRSGKLDRARDDLDRLARAAGSHHLYRDVAAVTARIATIAGKRRVARYLVAETSTDPDTRKPTLVWHFDQTALDAEAATDGWYAQPDRLLTLAGGDRAGQEEHCSGGVASDEIDEA